MFAALDKQVRDRKASNQLEKGVSTKVLTHRNLAIMFAALDTEVVAQKAAKTESGLSLK